jgi:DNA-binding transcriptional MerR regulator
LNNQAGEVITVRNIRYYQSMGLVDRPADSSGQGFGEKHRLQLQAIRLLQARGLPLGKMQSLLYGRDEKDLREIERRGLAELQQAAPPPLPVQAGWEVVALAGDCLLLLGNGRTLTAAQRAKIAQILQPSILPSGKDGKTEKQKGE